MLELRKRAAGLHSHSTHPCMSAPGSEASSDFAASLASTSLGGLGSRAVSRGGEPGLATRERQPAAAQLAELGAKAEAAASRPLVVSTAVDSSLQAVQAAKESLQHMHDTDMLKLFSQSVQDVLAHKVCALHSAKQCWCRHAMISYYRL